MKINLFKYSNKHHRKLQKDNNNNKASDKIKRMNKLRKWIFFGNVYAICMYFHGDYIHRRNDGYKKKRC